MPTVTNWEFLSAIFGEDAPWTHVTDFTYDPANIPKDRHLAAWAGDYYCRYQFQPCSNQYFTISHFYADDEGKARRRKALYRHTRVIVLDDVKEKLSLDAVGRLPAPSWVLETSPGSEQWGYILTEPCKDRARVENLLDGLVANGLAPEGRDPGMKGVTRYVRLPEGYNLKAAKMVNGQPYKCQLLAWNPFNTVTLEDLAAPFSVNLDAARREQRVDGASDVPDHPLLAADDVINIKEVRSDGRFDITCPWVDEHTGADDSGSAVFTNDDGSIGFKCHHGACQDRTGADLLKVIEQHHPGFKDRLKAWQAHRVFEGIVSQQPAPPPVDFTQAPGESTPVAESPENGIQSLLDRLRRERPTSEEARQCAAAILQLVDDMPEIDKKSWHDQVRDLMHWSKSDFKDILNDLRKEWYSKEKKSYSFFDTVLYVKELNQFYDWQSRLFFSPEGFQNSFAHEDHEARKTALQEGHVVKVDKLDYAPKQPIVFQEKGLTFGNMWSAKDEYMGAEGDASPWLDHFSVLGWGEERKHMLQWMAYTLKYPEKKINHMLILGSREGGGKDFLLYPLIMAMGEHCEVISGEELLSNFNDYILSTKYLHINETELGDRQEAQAITNKLKPLAAAPPESLRVNQKNIAPIKVRNILNGTMTTNSRLPLRQNSVSRRFFAVWSEINTRDNNDEMLPEWRRYWSERWEWMQTGGVEYCIWYLRNRVDLSDFNPFAAPPMTEFLRDIREASKTPMQIAIEAFIEREIGAFSSDLMTADDALNTIRAGEMVAPDVPMGDTRFLTPSKISIAMNDINTCVRLRGRGDHYDVRIWAVRNSDKYLAMTPAELYHEYVRQIDQARQKPKVYAVK